MQFIYDDLTATIVATTTILLLFTIQSRATQNNVARTSRNVMKGGAQEFATWIEKDLQRMGKNMDQEEKESQPPFGNPQTDQFEGGESYTSQFTFYRDKAEKDGGERIATRYHLEEIEEGSQTLLELTRKKKVGTGSWSSVDGRSPPLGYFEVQMLDRDANTVSDPAKNLDQVHSVRVRFSVVSPFQSDRSITQATHVGSVLMVRNEEEGDDPETSVPINAGECTPNGWKGLTYPDGTGFSCAAECKYVATGGSKGSDCSKKGKGDGGSKGNEDDSDDDGWGWGWW